MMATAVKEAEINEKIENARKLFYSAVLAKKRYVRRNFLEMHSVANKYTFDTMSYRASLIKASKEDFMGTTEQKSETAVDCLDRINSTIGVVNEDNIDDESTLSYASEWVAYPDDYKWDTSYSLKLQDSSAKELYYYFPPEKDEEISDDEDIKNAFVDCDAAAAKSNQHFHAVKLNKSVVE